MANKRLTGLTEETDPASTDVVAIDGATTRKTTRANLLKENLEAIRALTSAADKGIQFTGAGTADVYDLTSAGKALLDDADAAAQRTTLGLVIGTDVQAYGASLTDVAGITFAQGDVLYHNGTNLVALAAGTSGDFLKTQGAGANPTWASIPGGGDLLSTNNLSDVSDSDIAINNINGVSYNVSQSPGIIPVRQAQANLNLPSIHRRPVTPWLPKWGAARANVIAGVSNAKLLFIGDSTTAGFGAQPSNVNSAAFSLPAYLAAELTSAGLNASWQSRWSDNNATASSVLLGTWDSRVTVGSFDFPVGTLTMGGPVIRATSGPGTPFTFTPTVSVDSFDFYWLGTAGTGSLSIDINGGTGTTINENIADSINKTTKTGSLASSTFNVTPVSGLTFFIGIVAYNSAAKEVSVINAGWGSGTAGNFNDTSLFFSSLNALGFLAPDLTIIDLTINDAIQNTSLSTYQTNLQAIITKAKISGDVILVGGVPIDPSVGFATIAKQTAINNMASALAAKNSVNFVSMFDLWGSYTDINDAGWSSDLQIHPNAAGYAAQAALLAPYLL